MDYLGFGRRVRHLRKEQRITLEELATKAGISASFLGNIERGTRVVSLETLVKLCQSLNTHPNYLLAFPVHQEALPFPDNMNDETRKQLMELFYQGNLVLQALSSKG